MPTTITITTTLTTQVFNTPANEKFGATRRSDFPGTISGESPFRPARAPMSVDVRLRLGNCLPYRLTHAMAPPVLRASIGPSRDETYSTGLVALVSSKNR